jgi:hypothetical protein
MCIRNERPYRGGVDGNCTAVQAVREFPVAKIRPALLTRLKKALTQHEVATFQTAGMLL